MCYVKKIEMNCKIKSSPILNQKSSNNPKIYIIDIFQP